MPALPKSSLQRSVTMPAQTGFAPQPGGRRAASTTARRKSARSRAASGRRSNLSKKVTPAVVKKMILDRVETKPFNSYTVPTKTVHVDSADAFGTLGLSTTVAKSVAAAGATSLQYGGATDMTELTMLRPFSTGATQDWEQQSALDGLTCIPLTGRVTLNMFRKHIHAEQIPNGFSLITSGPMRIRVIRVTPKGNLGAIETINPQQDLFRDQWHQEEGIQQSSVKPDMLESLPVNREKYTVLNDECFSLNRPVTWEHVSGNVGIGEFIANGNTTNPTSKVLVYYPQLAQRKGGQVRYKAPNDAATDNADMGQRREFILIHAWYPGVTDRGEMAASIVQDLNIRITPESRFKDA